MSAQTRVDANARSAGQLVGSPMLHSPHEKEAGYHIRTNTLCRSLYPALAPPPVKVQTNNNNTTSGASASPNNTSLMLMQPTTSTSGSTALATLHKRSRDDAHEIISMDPTRLKAQHQLEISRAARDATTNNNNHNNHPAYHPPPPWKMRKVLVGHQGWVWSAAIDPTNAWLATGAVDAVIKVWDLHTGALKTNLTGHSEAVRGLAVSTLSPYMFSGSDDHSVKCWDLERNEAIRSFFGHRSGVFAVAAHPRLDIIFSAGRDRTVRVWDLRSREAVHTLVGHEDGVMALATQAVEPQVVSGGNDGHIFLWDLAAGKAMTRLTRHKKAVRGLAMDASGKMLISCGADNIRVWDMPLGKYVCSASTTPDGAATNKSGERQYRWSCCAMSRRNVLAVCSQDGEMALYDWNRPQVAADRRYFAPFQLTKTKSMPGTLVGEGGINAVVYDNSGTRLITAESDKSVKMWAHPTSSSS